MTESRGAPSMSLIMLPVLVHAPFAAALAASFLLVVPGCGESSGRGTASVDGIEQTLADLEDALAARDSGRICDRIFSPAARRRAGGEECRRRLSRTTEALDSPRLELVSVTLGNDSAIARVRAEAGGAPPAIDSMRFVSIEGAYRVDSLSSG